MLEFYLCLYLRCHDTFKEQNDGLVIIVEGLNCCNNIMENSKGEDWGGCGGKSPSPWDCVTKNKIKKKSVSKE